VLGAYTALTVWWLWPLVAVWHTHSGYFYDDFPPAVADFYLIVWALAWDSHALITSPSGLFHANAFHPSTLSLAYSEHFLGYVPLFAPVYWATGNPLFAINVMTFATYPLCALAMYCLARRWVGAPAAAVAGFFYAFSVFRYHMPPHVHQLGVQYLPLVLLFTERWLAAGRARDALLLAGALVLQALSSFYLAYALALAYGAYLALALWRWRRGLDRRRLGGLALVGAVTAGVIVAVSLPYLRLQQLGLIPSFTEQGQTPVGLIQYFAARPLWRYAQEGLGPVGYTLALVAVAPPWRARRWPRLLAVVFAALGTLLAFGTGIHVGRVVLWSPYRLLMDWVPGFSTLRIPSRFLVITHLGLALAAGLGLARLLGRARPRVAWPVAILTVAAALVSFAPFPTLPLHREPTGDAVPAVYRWLGAHGEGRPLLELPGAGFAVSARRMYLSTYHWLPIVDGYSGYPPGTSAHLHFIAHGLPAVPTLQALVDAADIGWILVHRDELPADERGVWDAPPNPDGGLEQTGTWGDDLLLRVTLPPRPDRHPLMSTTETPGGTPLAPLGTACPGAIRLRRAPASPWAPGSVVLLAVEVENQGTVTWPAFGFYPRHLVRLVVTVFTDRGMRVGRPLELGLPRDVRPGEVVPLVFPYTALAGPGGYELELALVQREDGPLAGCGVSPLRVPVSIASGG